MGARGRLRSGVVALALVGFAMACEGEAERTFYDDLDATDGTISADGMKAAGDATEDGGTGATGDAAVDATVDGMTGTGTDGAPDAGVGPDAEAGSEAAVDGGSDAPVGDGAADSAPEAEAGCGPLDTVESCGACGRACNSTHSLDAGCNGAACTYSGCATGYGDCDASPPNTNGCETPLSGVSNCTGCGIACDTTTSLDAGCNGATCTYSGCKAGFANCTTTPPDNNGCETPTSTTANCGGCGVACGSQHTTDAGCTGTACAYSCSPGWINCDTKPPNTLGCECNTPSCCTADGGVGSCQTTHATGFPSLSYYDCNPIATAGESQAKLLTQAIEACTAYTGAVNQCATGLTCTGSSSLYVCNGMGGSSCDTCWSYAGSDVLKTENCSCPPNITVIGTWN